MTTVLRNATAARSAWRGIDWAAACKLSRCISSSRPRPSGHNRWSKIRHRKGAADAQRSSLFSRITGLSSRQDIHSALRAPSSQDPSSNSRLATALQKAKEAGVPKSVVENCFAKARAAAEGTGQSIAYEAVGPSGREAFIIECITENASRTVQRLKETLHKQGCRMAPVSFLFERKGVIILAPRDRVSFDEVFEAAVEAGAEDVKEVEDEEGTAVYEIITPPQELASISTTLTTSATAEKLALQSSEISYIPLDPLRVRLGTNESSKATDTQDVDVSSISESQAEAVERVVSMLEAEADVVRIWTNLNLDG